MCKLAAWRSCCTNGLVIHVCVCGRSPETHGAVKEFVDLVHLAAQRQPRVMYPICTRTGALVCDAFVSSEALLARRCQKWPDGHHHDARRREAADCSCFPYYLDSSVRLKSDFLAHRLPREAPCAPYTGIFQPLLRRSDLARVGCGMKGHALLEKVHP